MKAIQILPLAHERAIIRIGDYNPDKHEIKLSNVTVKVSPGNFLIIPEGFDIDNSQDGTELSNMRLIKK